jgi:Uma2 family endonuclease
LIVESRLDFVVEILSPSTAMKDLSKKKELYAKHGVREYWILNPEDLSILAYRRDGDGFGRALEYRHGEAVDSSVLPGFVWQSSLR